MWTPPLNFVFLHYCYIVLCALISFVIIYAYGNLSAVDAFFFGCSGNTESGLNTVDVKALKTYQQLVIYFFPIITNLGFINIAVVVVRLYWFEKRLRKYAPATLRGGCSEYGNETVPATGNTAMNHAEKQSSAASTQVFPGTTSPVTRVSDCGHESPENETNEATTSESDHLGGSKPQGHDANRNISWAAQLKAPSGGKALRVPSPRERENGLPFQEVDDIASENDYADSISPVKSHEDGGFRHRKAFGLSSAATTMSLDQVASSMFVLGKASSGSRSRSRPTSISRAPSNLPQLSSQATEGRNSQFFNLTVEDREKLGGMEYRALKLLLKIILGYFFGLQSLGVICLLPWIHNAPAKYTEYLASQGQDKTWWAFYSSQTMVNNLGFTLTPDSMLSFADATWPMLVMTFLAFAGNTCYPVLLRLVIWTMTKILPKKSTMQDPLRFLLDHPRRCYTLLFPSKPTWILFAILFAMNFIDVLLIIVLDLDNPAVTTGLSPGPRVLAALFQAASSRHTGTATFNLAEVNPAVQFSLLVMMYISIFPIAFSIRASNSYEEQALGRYGGDNELDDHQKSSTYLMSHIRNQLSFDLWYIFIGVFCICIAEASRIADNTDPAFSVFAILFEVVSGYGNVGLSLGHPTVLTSLCGKFTIFSKIVVCAMMIRGRHRGLPVNLDRAIMLPGEDLVDEDDRVQTAAHPGEKLKLKRFYTN